MRILQEHSSISCIPCPGHKFSSCFSCPHGHTRLASHPFDPCVNKQVFCSTCRRPWLSSHWHCTCQIPWHACVIHFSSFNPRSLLSVGSSSTSRTRPSSSAFTSEVAEKKLRKVEHGAQLPHMKLGPIRAARFPHLAARGSATS